MEGFGNGGELCEFGEGLQAGNDGNGNACLMCLLNEGKEFLVVVEELCDGDFGTLPLLFQEYADVAFEIWCFLVLLGIGGNSEFEGRSLDFDGCVVGKESVIEAVHLLNEFEGMGVASRGRLVDGFLFGLVATQEEDVANAKEL